MKKKLTAIFLAAAMVFGLCVDSTTSLAESKTYEAQATGTVDADVTASVELTGKDEDTSFDESAIIDTEKGSYGIKYTIDASAIKDSIAAGDKITFKIPKAIVFPGGSVPEAASIEDTDGGSGTTLTAAINGSAGSYTVTATLDTLNTNESKKWDGKFTYWAQVNFDASKLASEISSWDENSGTIDLDLGYGNKTTIKQTATITPSLLTSKASSVEVDTADSSKANITWTVTLKPTTTEGRSGVYFRNVDLTDVIGTNQTLDESSLKIAASGSNNISEKVLTKGTDYTYDTSTKKLVINFSAIEGVKASDKDKESVAADGGTTYTLTYKTSVALTDWKDLNNASTGTFVSEENTVNATYDYKKNISDTTDTSAEESESNTAELKYDQAGLIKKGGEKGTSGSLKWTVNVNTAKLTNIPSDGVTITDTLPAQTTETDGKYYQNLSATADGSNITIEDSQISVNTSGTSPVLTIKLTQEQVQGKAIVITYETTYDATKSGFTNGTEYVNNVKLGIGPGYSINAAAAKVKVSTGSLLTKGTATGWTYDPAAHSFTWTINFKNYVSDGSNDSILNKFTLVDKINDDQEIVSASYKSKAKSASAYGSEQNVSDLTMNASREVTLLDTTTATNDTATDYVFTVVTRLTDAQVAKWTSNTSGETKNIAIVRPDSTVVSQFEQQGIKSSYSVTATAKYSSTMIAKESSAVDQTSHEMTWKVTVNQNKLTVTGGKTSDLIPAGMVYVDGSLTGDGSVFTSSNISVASTTVTNGQQTLVVNLPDSFEGQGYYTYKTKIDTSTAAGQALQRESKKEVTNTVTLAGSVPSNDGNSTLAIADGVKATAKATVTSAMAEKTPGTRKGNKIPYTVTVNVNQAAIKNATLVDTLPTGVALIPDSIEIVEQSVAANGNLTATVTKKTDYTLTFNGSSFTIGLGDITKAYKITYKVAIIKDAGGTTGAVNQISFLENGNLIKKASSSAVNAQYASAGGSTSGSAEDFDTDSYANFLNTKGTYDPTSGGVTPTTDPTKDPDDSKGQQGTNGSGNTVSSGSGKAADGASATTEKVTGEGTVDVKALADTTDKKLPQTGGFLGTPLSYGLGVAVAAVGEVLYLHGSKKKKK